MVHIKASTNNKEETEQRNRFSTYLNYLTSLHQHIGSENIRKELSLLPESTPIKSIEVRKEVSVDDIARLLRNAWFTEMQIWIAGTMEGYVAFANHWICVQSYYSIHLALRALFLAMGNNVSSSHAANLKAIGEIIKIRPDLFSDPWRILCVGDPSEEKSTFLNLPRGVLVNPNQISPLTKSSRVNFYDSFGMFLKTTRKRQIIQKCKRWKLDNNKKKIDSKAKSTIIKNVSPTSLFDCLFRLRVRSNYEDADSFMIAVENEREAVEFNEAVRNVVWHGLFLMENLIARYISKDKYDEIINEFSSTFDKREVSTELVIKRWKEIKQVWK